MAKVVIIGASVAGHNAAVQLREKSPDTQILIITDEEYPFYDKRRLPDFLAGSVTEKELFLASDSFYQERGIDLLKGKKVTGLNTGKRCLTLKEKEKISYDYLVIASGRRFITPDVPGAKKDGVFTFNSLCDYRQFLSRLILHPVCVVGSNEAALQAAKAVCARFKIEVKLIAGTSVDNAQLSPEIEIIPCFVQEIIGEGEVQAIKLKEGKAIGVAAVIFMNELKSSIDFLKNTDLEMIDDFLLVDELMRTSREEIFSCGSVCRMKTAVRETKNWDDAVAEASSVSDSLVKAMKGELCRT